jgi:hypothetical protein
MGEMVLTGKILGRAGDRGISDGDNHRGDVALRPLLPAF